MDKAEKFLRKLSKSERGSIEEIITSIVAGDFLSLDLKKLKGEKETYRVRKGRIRVIFSNLGDEIRILSVQFRDEQTYR